MTVLSFLNALTLPIASCIKASLGHQLVHRYLPYPARAEVGHEIAEQCKRDVRYDDDIYVGSWNESYDHEPEEPVEQKRRGRSDHKRDYDHGHHPKRHLLHKV